MWRLLLGIQRPNGVLLGLSTPSMNPLLQMVVAVFENPLFMDHHALSLTACFSFGVAAYVLNKETDLNVPKE